jgi:hypothetical protein
MSYRIEFELAGLPQMANIQNGKSHWRHQHKEAQKWKGAAMLAASSKGKPPRPLTRASLTLTRFSSVCPDPDGLVRGFKHVIDGLVAAGVLENDRYSNIGMPHYRWEEAPPKKGFLRVVVEAVE